MAEQGPANKKRRHNLSWEDYFMGLAGLAAMRSKDPVTQVGACIVAEDNSIVAMGYNGMPNGDDNSFTWGKGTDLDNKHLYVCHAERNALNYAKNNITPLKTCTLYVTLYPCNECAKSIIQAGIKKVVYLSNKHRNKQYTRAAKKMFEEVGTSIEQYRPINNPITIVFED